MYIIIYIFRPDMIDHVRQDTTFLYYKLDIRSKEKLCPRGQDMFGLVFLLASTRQYSS